MAHRSRARKARAPAIKTTDDRVFAYDKAQLAKADRELAVMAKAATEGRRVNAEAGDLAVTHVMHRKHYFNALAAGEDPHRDSMYHRDMVKRGAIVPVRQITGNIVSRPLSDEGRENFEHIFRSRR